MIKKHCDQCDTTKDVKRYLVKISECGDNGELTYRTGGGWVYERDYQPTTNCLVDLCERCFQELVEPFSDRINSIVKKGENDEH